jgi:hypothetical protein
MAPAEDLAVDEPEVLAAPGPAELERPAAHESSGLRREIVVAVAVLGLVVRMVILATPLGRADSDEVLSGLMARNVAGDWYPPFLWGQHYGGTVELAPVILSMKLFGTSVLAMRIPNLFLAAINCVLVWRIARRFLPERSAQVAAALLWLGPANAVWFGVREQLFYPPTVTLGLGFTIFAFRIRERARLVDFALFGLFLGVAFWTSPNLVYYAVPAAFVLVWDRHLIQRLPRLALGALVAVPAAILGALPWIHDYLRYDGLPMRARDTFPTTGTYWTRVANFFTEALPGALGFRATFTHDWILGPLGVVGYVVVLVVLLLAAARALRRAHWDGIGFVCFPFLFALIPWVIDDPNLRYTFFVVPFVGVLVGRMITTTRVAVVALALTLLFTGIGLERIYTISEIDRGPYRVGNVGDLDEAIRVLDANGITAVFGDYWVAYRIDFETDERIIASPSWGIDRYERYTRTVRASPRSAWVVLPGDQEAALRAALQGLGVGAQFLPAGELVVVVPDRPVMPEQVPEAARRPLTTSPRS